MKRLGVSARLLAVACAAGLASAGTLLALGVGWPALGAGLLSAAAVMVLGHLLLARPLRRLADSVTALHPGTPPGDEVAGDELARAARAVVAIGHRLRLAEWRQARLGAIAAGAATVSHDLRGTLAPALLGAERLQFNAEPGIKRIGDIVVRAVERAIELVRGGLDFAREGHQLLPPGRFPLADAIAEAVTAARATVPGMTVEVTQDAAIEVFATREEVVRSLHYLLRRCGEPPATKVFLSVRVSPTGATLEVTSDGPLPAAQVATPFSPFGSVAGLELAIARDLARSNGGSVVLEYDGPRGPTLRLSLPIAASRPAISQPAA